MGQARYRPAAVQLKKMVRSRSPLSAFPLCPHFFRHRAVGEGESITSCSCRLAAKKSSRSGAAARGEAEAVTEAATGLCPRGDAATAFLRAAALGGGTPSGGWPAPAAASLSARKANARPKKAASARVQLDHNLRCGRKWGTHVPNSFSSAPALRSSVRNAQGRPAKLVRTLSCCAERTTPIPICKA